MFEKDMSIGFLLDFYGSVLSEHTRTFLSLYYGEDLSLAEIASEAGVSRQAVRQAIKKGEEELRFLEEKLGLAAQFTKMREIAARLQKTAADLSARGTDPSVCALAREAEACAALILFENTEKEEP